MGDYGKSGILMTAREFILEQEGYYVYNPMKIVPHDTPENLKNRILINRLMECKQAYIMTGYEKSPVNHVIVDLVVKLNYKIIHEE